MDLAVRATIHIPKYKGKYNAWVIAISQSEAEPDRKLQKPSDAWRHLAIIAWNWLIKSPIIYIYPHYYLQNNWELFNILLFLKYSV